jgi:hypothetical protein
VLVCGCNGVACGRASSAALRRVCAERVKGCGAGGYGVAVIPCCQHTGQVISPARFQVSPLPSVLCSFSPSSLPDSLPVYILGLSSPHPAFLCHSPHSHPLPKISLSSAGEQYQLCEEEEDQEHLPHLQPGTKPAGWGAVTCVGARACMCVLACVRIYLRACVCARVLCVCVLCLRVCVCVFTCECIVPAPVQSL